VFVLVNHTFVRFPSFWFGDRLPIAPSFHLNARDVVLGVDGQNEGPQQSQEERHDADIRNTARFFVRQILLNCQASEAAAADINAVLSSHLTANAANEGEVFDLSTDLSDHSEERDRQLGSGVLMRLDRVQQILRAIRRLDESLSSSQETTDCDQYVRRIRLLADDVPSEDMNRFKHEDVKGGVKVKPAVSSHISSHSDVVSELDKLRIISQVAYNFL
jgi:hypothetical protein